MTDVGVILILGKLLSHLSMSRPCLRNIFITSPVSFSRGGALCQDVLQRRTQAPTILKFTVQQKPQEKMSYINNVKSHRRRLPPAAPDAYVRNAFWLYLKDSCLC